jgi:methylated-DNA-[protein]-cysteine S-methyltransferase
MDETTDHYLIFETVAGFCGIAWNDVGITRFQLPAKSAETARRSLLRRLPEAEQAAPPQRVQGAIASVRRYFEGEATDFADLELDLAGASAFFRQVYAAARSIGWGHTTTYGALARELGAPPQAARDVGEAMAHNPVPLIIPCHRVLAAGGKLGGFSAPGGGTTKLRMLELEGIRVSRTAPEQGSFRF